MFTGILFREPTGVLGRGRRTTDEARSHTGCSLPVIDDQRTTRMSTMGTPAPPDPHPGPSAATGRLSRCRMRADRPGPRLRAGETVRCADCGHSSGPCLAAVRCESDGYGPGVLLSHGEVEFLESTGDELGPMSWGKPGARA